MKDHQLTSKVGFCILRKEASQDRIKLRVVSRVSISKEESSHIEDPLSSYQYATLTALSAYNESLIVSPNIFGYDESGN